MSALKKTWYHREQLLYTVYTWEVSREKLTYKNASISSSDD